MQTVNGPWHNELALLSSEKGQHVPLSLQTYDVLSVIAANVDEDLIYFIGIGEIYS